MRQNVIAMRTSIESLKPQELVLFTYPKALIMKMVEARTTVTGQMRGDKDNPDYIERMALTEGESYLSDDMLLDAIIQVHSWLQAFSRSIEHPYGIDQDDNIFFVLQPKNWWARNEYAAVELNIKNALIEYIISQWFVTVNPQEAEFHAGKYEEYAHQAQLGMNTSTGPLERRFNTPFNTVFGR